MTFELQIARRVRSYVDRLDHPTQRRVLERLDDIAEDPYGPRTKALTNASGLRSARVGYLRIVFEVHAARRLVLVESIGPRGRAYRDV